MSKWFASASLAALLAASALPTSAQAQSALAFFNPQPSFGRLPPQIASPQAVAPGDDETDDLPARLRRQVVDYPSREAPGTIIVDTPHTYLYYVLGGGKAVRYGIGVGREGFTW